MCMEYAVSGLAGISTTHLQCVPEGRASKESPKRSPIFDTCRHDPAGARGTEECKSEGTDLANCRLVAGAIQ